MIEELIERIGRQQSTGEPAFHRGHFRANRSYPYLRLQRADNNLFYTALTLSVLKNTKPTLDDPARAMIDRITEGALANYHHYRVEREGVKVYQFWPEGKHHHFPNGTLLHRFKKFKSPPDADDTALAYQTYPHTRTEAAQFQVYLQQFANGSRKWNRKISANLNLPKVYATWMGTGAMPIEFDVVVMSNLLRTFRQYGLPVNEYDQATLDYLSQVIRSGLYRQKPFVAAPWYPSALIIHYHLVKLMVTPGFPDPDLWKEQLVTHLRDFQPQSLMEKILWNSSARRLGQQPVEVVYGEHWEDRIRGFTFYIGGMLTALNSRISWYLAQFPAFHWRFRCDAFYYALLLEHEVLRKQPSLKQNGRKQHDSASSGQDR